MRHTHSALIPYHCREAEVLSSAAIAVKYPALPAWWASREGTFSDLTETPPCVSYIGSMLMDPFAPAWVICQSELALLRLAELIVNARAGRLLWISSGIYQDIMSMGVDELLADNSADVRRDAKELLSWVRRVRWEETSPENRFLPGRCNEITPTFVSGGDWIGWDPVA